MEQSEEQIYGKATYAEVEHRLREYHSSRKGETEHFEADIVSTRISSILQTESFAFAPPMLRHIHRHLFDGVVQGRLGRTVAADQSDRRRSLFSEGYSVSYAPFHLVREMLDYDFGQEKERQARYPQTGRHEIASSAFGFVSGLWQIHPFREGNTRTTAVFAILYFRQLGFTISDEPFASNAQYFQDALVLDNTFDPDFKNPAPLRRFMEKMLFDPSIELKDLREAPSPIRNGR